MSKAAQVRKRPATPRTLTKKAMGRQDAKLRSKTPKGYYKNWLYAQSPDENTVWLQGRVGSLSFALEQLDKRRDIRTGKVMETVVLSEAEVENVSADSVTWRGTGRRTVRN